MSDSIAKWLEKVSNAHIRCEVEVPEDLDVNPTEEDEELDDQSTSEYETDSEEEEDEEDLCPERSFGAKIEGAETENGVDYTGKGVMTFANGNYFEGKDPRFESRSGLQILLFRSLPWAWDGPDRDPDPHN